MHAPSKIQIGISHKFLMKPNAMLAMKNIMPSLVFVLHLQTV
jgi:hypothetical protein